MPEPEIDGIETFEPVESRWRIRAYIERHGNKRHRLARMHAILANLRRNDWRCIWCGAKIAMYKRADAVFCGEGCRKRAARLTRKAR